jgi:hypothetical protein
MDLTYKTNHHPQFSKVGHWNVWISRKWQKKCILTQQQVGTATSQEINHLPWLGWLFIVHIRTLTNHHSHQPFSQISIYTAHRQFKFQMMATSVHWNVGCISTNSSQTQSQYSTTLQISLLMSHLPSVLFTDIIHLFFLPNYDICTLDITALLF